MRISNQGRGAYWGLQDLLWTTRQPTNSGWDMAPALAVLRICPGAQNMIKGAERSTNAMRGRAPAHCTNEAVARGKAPIIPQRSPGQGGFSLQPG